MLDLFTRECSKPSFIILILSREMLQLNNWKKTLRKVDAEVTYLRAGGLKKSLKQQGSEAFKKKFFLMLIPREKRDSETDSTDLIICGSTRECDWKEIQKNSNLWATVTKQRISLGLYSWPWNSFGEKKNSCGETTQTLNIQLCSGCVTARHLTVKSKLSAPHGGECSWRSHITTSHEFSGRLLSF